MKINDINVSSSFIISLFFLSSCTIEPLYDEGNSDSVDRHSGNGTSNGISHCGIHVGSIADRDGQKLRSCLIDSFRDLDFAPRAYALDVQLSHSEKYFAFSTDGYAKRKLFSYFADIKLTDKTSGKDLLKKRLMASTCYNISQGQWGVAISLYGQYNEALIRDLSYKIVESITVFLHNTPEIRKNNHQNQKYRTGFPVK